VGIDYRYTNYRFAAPTTINGLPFDSDSNDSTSSLEFAHALSGKTTLDGSFGYLKRHYLRENRGSFSGQVWHAKLSWQATAKTRVDLAVNRDLSAALESQSDYYVAKGGSITPVWAPTTRISLGIQAGWSTQDYLGASPSAIQYVSRHDKLANQQVYLQYQPRDALTFNLSFQHEYRDSNVPVISYNDKVVSASFQLTLGARSDTGPRTF
jgi:hypothetical protein